MKASRLDDFIGPAAHDVGAQVPENAVSDRATLGGLTQFRDDRFRHVCKPLNPNRIEEHRDLKEGFALHCSGPLASR